MELNNAPQPTSTTSSFGNLGNAQRPGEYLRQLRLSQKRELADVARALNMPERQVAAIEADDYKALPEPAFIKGYLRAYSKLLSVDAGPLILRFNEIYTSDTGLPNNHALENSPLKVLGRLQRGRKPGFKWFKWLVIILIAAAVIWALVAGVRYWRNAKNSEPVAEQASSPVQPIQDSNPVSVSTAPTVLSLPSAPVSHQDQLTLSFKKPVDVLIKDATGKTLASGTQSDALSLTGDSPFSIRLADATQVSLTMNNESVSLSPYTVNGRADFRLSR